MSIHSYSSNGPQNDTGNYIGLRMTPRGRRSMHPAVSHAPSSQREKLLQSSARGKKMAVARQVIAAPGDFIPGDPTVVPFWL